MRTSVIFLLHRIEDTAEHVEALLDELAIAGEPLVDERIRQADRKTPIWHYSSGELWTPLSLPLWISITLGAKNDLQIWSADTRLLEVELVDCGIAVSLLLPTDEKLNVRVEERRYGAIERSGETVGRRMNARSVPAGR